MLCVYSNLTHNLLYGNQGSSEEYIGLFNEYNFYANFVTEIQNIPSQ